MADHAEDCTCLVCTLPSPKPRTGPATGVKMTAVAPGSTIPAEPGEAVMLDGKPHPDQWATTAEAAELLGISHNALRVRLHRGTAPDGSIITAWGRYWPRENLT